MGEMSGFLAVFALDVRWAARHHRCMKQIDHDPNEFIDKRAGWPSTWLIVGLIWAANLYFFSFYWRSFALGLLTGCILVAWAMDITGGKIPASWRSKAPRRPGS